MIYKDRLNWIIRAMENRKMSSKHLVLIINWPVFCKIQMLYTNYLNIIQIYPNLKSTIQIYQIEERDLEGKFFWRSLEIQIFLRFWEKKNEKYFLFIFFGVFFFSKVSINELHLCLNKQNADRNFFVRGFLYFRKIFQGAKKFLGSDGALNGCK